MYEHKCIACEGSFTSKRSHSKYCSDTCGARHRYQTKPKYYTGTCLQCGCEAKGRKPNPTFCSAACINTYHKNSDVEKTCPCCNKTWNVPYHERDKSTYCSHACARKTRWSEYEPEEKQAVSKKISEGHIRGYKNGTINKRWRENNPSWKGGITKINQAVRGSTRYKLWRAEVFERDNYTCVECGTPGGVLNADHIVPFSHLLKEHDIKTPEQADKCEELWDISNGRTLCIEHHKQTDTYGGKATKYENTGT